MNCHPKAISRYAVTACIFLLAFLLCFMRMHALLIPYHERWVYGYIESHAGLYGYAIAMLLVPATIAGVLAWIIWRLHYWRDYHLSIPPLIRRAGILLLVFSYAATALFGVPATVNEINRELSPALVGDWKAEDSETPPPDVSVKYYISAAVAPGLVLTLHDQSKNTWAWLGWRLYFWYGGEPKWILTLRILVS